MTTFDRSRAVWLARNVLPHEPSLRAWLHRQRHLALDPDDIVQESYAILAALKQVEHITFPRAYLFQTAKSLILRDFRRAKIVSILAVDDLDALGAATEEPSPERQASDRQQLRRLADAVDALPGRCQEIFKLRKIEGASQKAIAARLGLSEKTVEKQVAKAVRRLMDALGRGGEPPSRASIASNGQSEHVFRKSR